MESQVLMANGPVREASAQGVADAAVRFPGGVFDEMTHAVVNALNTIAAASELAALLIAREEPAEAAEPLMRIESECMRAARLLRDGRELMTLDVHPAQDAIDIPGLLNGCTETFAGRVRVDADAALPVLRGDANALRRACKEILDNAFTFGANRVHVAVKHPASARGARIEFHDDGPGIEIPTKRLFDPFFSSRPAERSGLGLALVARIVAAHGGCAGVDDSGQGTIFWLELPAREA